MKPKKTLAKLLGAPGRAGPEADKRGPWASDPPAGSRQGTRPDRGVDAATTSRGAARAHVARGDGGGAGVAGPETGRRCAHGVEGTAASLTGGDAGEERQRRGGVTDRGGGGRRRAAAALQGGG